MADEEIPDRLKALAAELDEWAGTVPDPGGANARPTMEGADFELLAEIGRGGMGVVYEARQRSLDRVVAVKLLAPHCADGASFRERFTTESRLIARLHHPNIVEVYAAGTQEDTCFFAMERVVGDTAGDHAFSSLDEVLSCGIQIAEALAYAHDCGVIHRDVKPANIFLAASGVAKLGDFGLACCAGEATDASGTRRYLAPEVMAGGQASPASDQYALGGTLLELAEPFQRGNPNPDLAAVLDKATQSIPADRYAVLADFAADLRRVRAQEPVFARSASPARQLRLWSRRNPAAFWGTMFATACLAGLIVALICGYARTHRALMVAEQARAETQAALCQVEDEAARAALSFADTLAHVDRSGGDFRAAEINRAIAFAEALAVRFPDNADIAAALDKLRQARESHARFRERRGGGRFRGGRNDSGFVVPRR